MPVVALRPVEDGDLDALFDQGRDPEAVWMAAFTAEDPGDRQTFDAHMTAGFTIIGTENSYAPGRHSVIEETILRLE